jgi:ElaB/YqjD/DUF883 family membrane-anchored ribosome-binding protein
VSHQNRQLERATATARAARDRLNATLGAVQRRLSPHSLVDGAWRKVRNKSVDIAEDTVSLAKRHPVETAAAAAVVTGVIARRPIAQALSRLFSRRKETSSGATGSSTDSPGSDQS